MQLSERERERERASERASEGGRLKGLHYSALRKEIRERRSLGASAARSNSSARSLLGYCCPRVCVRASKWGLVSVYGDIFREYTKDTLRRWQQPWLEGVSSGELEQGRGHTAKAREREGQREREHTLFESQVAGNSLRAATPPAAKPLAQSQLLSDEYKPEGGGEAADVYSVVLLLSQQPLISPALLALYCHAQVHCSKLFIRIINLRGPFLERCFIDLQCFSRGLRRIIGGPDALSFEASKTQNPGRLWGIRSFKTRGRCYRRLFFLVLPEQHSLTEALCAHTFITPPLPQRANTPFCGCRVNSTRFLPAVCMLQCGVQHVCVTGYLSGESKEKKKSAQGDEEEEEEEEEEEGRTACLARFNSPLPLATKCFQT
ncbi:unnamed protein product [Leuciscus chuanchicus]